MVEPHTLFGVQSVWKAPGIDRVIVKRDRGSLTAFQRPPQPRTGGTPAPVDAVPQEHLLLRVGARSAFGRPGTNHFADGGPLELRLIGLGRDELVAVWYSALNPLPSVPPLFTPFGWHRGVNAINEADRDTRVSRSLTDALSRS